MTTALIIAAVLLGVLALAGGGAWAWYRAGQRLGSDDADKLSAEHEAKVAKAVADALAQPTTREDVIRDLDKGEF